MPYALALLFAAQVFLSASAESQTPQTERVGWLDSQVVEPFPLLADSGFAPSVPVLSSSSRAQQVIRDVMSPFCPGLSLEACPSPDAQILRTEIRQEMAKGKTEEEIRASLVNRFGYAVLGIPPDDLWGKMAWTLPWIALLLGGIGITFWLRRRTERTAADDALNGSGHTPGQVSERDADLLEQIRREVSKGDAPNQT